MRLMGQNQMIPHMKMIPFNAFFPIIERDVLRTLKFGRKKDDPGNDPDFVGFDTKVVSRRHSEIWAVNGEVSFSPPFFHPPFPPSSKSPFPDAGSFTSATPRVRVGRSSTRCG